MTPTDTTPSAETASIAPPPPPAAASPDGGPIRRGAFRFVAVYLLLYCLPFPLGTIPGTYLLSAPYEAGVDAATGWFGTSVLRLEKAPPRLMTGSGDTPIEYVKAAFFAAVALAAALVWSAAARRVRSHPRLHDLLRVYVRFALASIMFGYGFAKVFKTQFQMPEGELLFTPLGQKSPMGLLWTFMGYSTPYTVFVGAAEVLGGALLLWRRTTTLGALVVALVMFNVTLLNFCYDVPVKLYAAHLFGMAAFLALPDCRRLVSTLVLNREAPPAVLEPFPPRGNWRWPVRSLHVLFAGYLVVGGAYGGYSSWREYGESAERPPLCGIYEVVEYLRDGESVPPLLGDATRWRRFGVSRYGLATVATMDDRVAYHALRIDVDKRELGLRAGGRRGEGEPAAEEWVLSYEAPTADELILTGPFAGATLRVRLKKYAPGSFLLHSRGFNWVQDYPFNR